MGYLLSHKVRFYEIALGEIIVIPPFERLLREPGVAIDWSYTWEPKEAVLIISCNPR